MQTITYILWKWNDDAYSVKYTAAHVNVMARMIARHTIAPHRIICITDDPVGIECETFLLWSDLKDLKDKSWEKWDDISQEKDRSFPSCYRRLKLFSGDTTRALGIEDGQKVVSMDLDMVITDTLDPLFAVETDFMGWHPDKKTSLQKIGYNGSIWVFRAGTCDFLWNDFDSQESPNRAINSGYYGDDQGWLSYKMYEKYPHWTAQDGILHYYPKLCSSLGLLPGTRIAVFYGKKWKPWHANVMLRSPWVKKHYR